MKKLLIAFVLFCVALVGSASAGKVECVNSSHSWRTLKLVTCRVTVPASKNQCSVTTETWKLCSACAQETSPTKTITIKTTGHSGCTR